MRPSVQDIESALVRRVANMGGREDLASVFSSPGVIGR